MKITSITTKGFNEDGELQVLFMFDPEVLDELQTAWGKALS